MKKESLAEYNNNPGNIRPGKLKYEGMIGVDDQGFAVFATPAAGRAALQQDVSVKLNRSMSARQFVDQYAPAGDNTEEARDNYVLSIMAALNLSSSADKIEATDENIQKVMSVIGRVESGKSQPGEESAAVEEPGVFEQLGQGVLNYAKENADTAAGLGIAGAGAYLASKIPGVAPAVRLGAQSLGSIGTGLAQTLGPKIPKAVGADVAARMFQANPAGSAINRGLQSGLARGAAAVGQGVAGAAAGAAALPVLGLTAGLGVPAYMMYKNYAKMTPLERQQRLEEAQQAGLPGP